MRTNNLSITSTAASITLKQTLNLKRLTKLINSSSSSGRQIRIKIIRVVISSTNSTSKRTHQASSTFHTNSNIRTRINTSRRNTERHTSLRTSNSRRSLSLNRSRNTKRQTYSSTLLSPRQTSSKIIRALTTPNQRIVSI